MKTKSKSTVLALSAALAVAAGVASAATVSWSSKENLSSTGSDLDNSGTILAAINFSTSKSPSTINGISFAVNNSLNGSGTYWDLDLNTNRSGWDPNRISYETYYGTGAWATFDLGSLIDDVIYMYTDAGEVHNLVIQNLTVGSEYRLQVVFEQAGNRDGQLRSGTDSPVVNYGANKGAALITAEWTADGPTQTFRQITHSGSVAGFVLTAIPEPSSLAVASLGLLGLAVRRRR